MPRGEPTDATTPRSRAGRARTGRRRRAAWGTISREDVIAAALRAVQHGRAEQVTIRALAAELGVAPMSLYRHVRDKDDLLEEVADRLLAEHWRPSVTDDDWRSWVAEAADNLRHLLVTQPAALHIYLRHPVVSPAAVDRMHAIVRVLRQAGLDEAAAHEAYAAIQTYTVGFAALQASRAGWVPPDPSTERRVRRYAVYTTPRQFGTGLQFLLAGISQGEPR